ncbi:MAG: DNA-processing protein DprA [Rickettsiales bacterium]|nr:DNA-processing protein DprA [Rickettsiales bacterium]
MLFAHSPQHPSLASYPLVDVLRLLRSQSVGPVTFFSLLRRYGTPKAALEALPELARNGGRKAPLVIPTIAEAEKEIAATHAHGATLIVYGSPAYPAGLLTLPDAPPVIAVLGNPELWQRDNIAIVGARNASAHGCQFAAQLARELGDKGFTIISGLARGIDAFAHKAALPTGTVGVIAGGIDTIYPPENEKLYANLREQGAIISEQPFSQLPYAGSFPGRNRIIAGMSLGTVVVEAAPRSGSLITARLAAEYGREVYAVPGSPMDPRAKGCNQLIKDGAHMVESAADIAAGLSPYRKMAHAEECPAAFTPAPKSPANEALGMEEMRAQLIEKLSANAVSVDELIEQCETSAQGVLTILLELELAGKLVRSAGNKVSVVTPQTQTMEETA